MPNLPFVAGFEGDEIPERGDDRRNPYLSWVSAQLVALQ